MEHTRERPCILLVEDDAAVALAQQEALARRGYAIRIAAGGEEAVTLSRRDEAIDLVLMEIDLGEGIDGTEAAEQILAHRDLPIVFLTSHTEEEYVERATRIGSYGYVTKQAGEFVLVQSVEIALRLFRTHRSPESHSPAKSPAGEQVATRRNLERERTFLSAVFDSIEEALIISDEHGRITRFNEAARRLHGLPEAPIPPDQWAQYYDLYRTDATTPLPVEEVPLYRALRGEHVSNKHIVVRPPGGSPRTLSCSGRAITDAGGETTGAVVAMHDITALKDVERELRRNAATFELLAGSSSDVIVQVDRELRATYVSPSARHIIGYDQQDFTDRSVLEVVHPDDRARLEAELAASIRAGSPALNSEYRLHTKSGDVRWVETRARIVYDDQGAFDGGVYRQTDITDRVAAEREVRKLLEQKETILKEVHHRIKNNINTLRALLTLQARSAPGAEARDALMDAERRVQSMAILFDKLYQTESTSTVSLDTYLGSLIDEVVSLFPNRSTVTVEKEIARVEVGTKTLAALGTIVNELLTNAMKHAFPNRGEGTLRVTAELADGAVTVTVADDGIGLSPGSTAGSESGHGLTLVRLLVDQLNGTLQIESDAGTRFVIRFAV